MFIGLPSFDRSLASESRIVHVALAYKITDREVSKHIKCASLNNQPCQPRPTMINLNPNELHYYPFVVSINSCGGICNTTDDLFGSICIPNKVKKIIFWSCSTIACECDKD